MKAVSLAFRRLAHSPSFSVTVRFLAALLAALALGALVVSTTGVYAATASAVSSRQREFAIRVTLGATVGRLVLLLVRAEVRAVGVGALAGLLGCFWLGRLLNDSLMGGRANELFAYSAVVALLGSVALAAISWPVLSVVRRMGRRHGLVDALR